MRLPLRAAFDPPYNLTGRLAFTQVNQAASRTALIAHGQQRARRYEGLLRSSRPGTPCPRGAARVGPGRPPPAPRETTAALRAFPPSGNATPRGAARPLARGGRRALGCRGRASRCACRPPPRSVLFPRSSAARPGARGAAALCGARARPQPNRPPRANGSRAPIARPPLTRRPNGHPPNGRRPPGTAGPPPPPGLWRRARWAGRGAASPEVSGGGRARSGGGDWGGSAVSAAGQGRAPAAGRFHTRRKQETGKEGSGSRSRRWRPPLAAGGGAASGEQQQQQQQRRVAAAAAAGGCEAERERSSGAAAASGSVPVASALCSAWDRRRPPAGGSPSRGEVSRGTALRRGVRRIAPGGRRLRGSGRAAPLRAASLSSPRAAGGPRRAGGSGAEERRGIGEGSARWRHPPRAAPGGFFSNRAFARRWPAGAFWCVPRVRRASGRAGRRAGGCARAAVCSIQTMSAWVSERASPHPAELRADGSPPRGTAEPGALGSFLPVREAASRRGSSRRRGAFLFVGLLVSDPGSLLVLVAAGLSEGRLACGRRGCRLPWSS